MTRPRKRLNLALQGGGAHGAFTWGVLDRLLEEDRFTLGWISATSAGAVNAAAMLAGLTEGGREGARSQLRRLWEGIHRAAVPDFVRLNPLLQGLGRMDQLAGQPVAQLMQMLSPQAFNPFDHNPLRDLLAELVDFDRLRRESPCEVLIAATEVATGKARLFRREELSLEAVLASACLPMLQRAVRIEDRYYWDGGFSANPDVLTLARSSPVADTLLVLLNPSTRAGLPTEAHDIAGQINHITFSQPLLREVSELRSLRRATAGLGGMLAPAEARKLVQHRFHLIEAGSYTEALPHGSKIWPDWPTMQGLFEAGSRETSRWLAEEAINVGRRESVDLVMRLLGQTSA